MIARLKLAVEDSLSFPATLMVKLLVPVALGVPLITPELLRFKPGGRVPETRDHVYGDVPPVAVRDWL